MGNSPKTATKTTQAMPVDDAEEEEEYLKPDRWQTLEKENVREHAIVYYLTPEPERMNQEALSLQHVISASM